MNLLFWRKGGKTDAQIRREEIAAELEATKGVVAPFIGVDYEQPVKAAAALATKKPGLMADAAERERVRLQRVHDSLLPCERDAAFPLSQRLWELNCEVLDQKYPAMDMSFLNWRRKADGWPVFAVYEPDSPVCEFRISFGEWGHARNERFPASPGDYSDVFRKMAATMRSEGSTMFNSRALRSTFKGIIPDTTRACIKSAVASGEFNKVLIVGEAVWEQIDSVVRYDPLVIGTLGTKGWLLDAFDLTPIERIVKAEFAGSPPDDWQR